MACTLASTVRVVPGLKAGLPARAGQRSQRLLVRAVAAKDSVQVRPACRKPSPGRRQPIWSARSDGRVLRWHASTRGFQLAQTSCMVNRRTR